MDHPLISEAHRVLRKRVLLLFKNAFKVQRESNIVFVCGGNAANHMRSLFKAFAAIHASQYDIFQPEFAMENLLSSGFSEPFDITDFEVLIGNLSRAIVIFPEAAGSFAETGYFSAHKELCKRIILVLDSDKQSSDSFISLGPAKKIGQDSLFTPVIQMSYSTPEFNLVVTRLKRLPLKKNLKQLLWNEISELSDFEYYCLIHEVVNVLTIATIEDLKFIFRGMSAGHLSVPKLHQITSILVGSKYLLEYGEFGHLRVNPDKGDLLNIIDGRISEYRDIKLELANLYLDEPDFNLLIGDI